MSISVGTMTRHDVVERHSSGLESAAGFGVIDSREEAHTFGHCVAMVPGWTEGVFLDQPTRREDDDYKLMSIRDGSTVCDGSSSVRRLTSQDGINTWILQLVNLEMGGDTG